MTILVVEDDKFLRHLVTTILEKDGFHIIEAQDGAAGYEAIQQMGNSVDLLLTDIIMPRMDGFSLAESASAIYPQMPILLMTGKPVEANVRSRYLVLNKPFRYYELIKMVRHAIVVHRVRSRYAATSRYRRRCGVYRPLASHGLDALPETRKHS